MTAAHARIAQPTNVERRLAAIFCTLAMAAAVAVVGLEVATVGIRTPAVIA